jgi:hypothetical protein
VSFAYLPDDQLEHFSWPRTVHAGFTAGKIEAVILVERLL